MGFDPVSLIAEATAAFGTGSAATGATAAATAATTATAATGAAAAGTAAAAGAGVAAGVDAAAAGVAAGAAGAAGATGAAAGLSASTLLSLGSAGVGLLGTAMMPKPPNPGQAPKAPSMFGNNGGGAALVAPSAGDQGGTFLTGNNRAPQISGGKKTLLGQ